jgi:hypothetical protein
VPEQQQPPPPPSNDLIAWAVPADEASLPRVQYGSLKVPPSAVPFLDNFFFGIFDRVYELVANERGVADAEFLMGPPHTPEKMKIIRMLIAGLMGSKPDSAPSDQPTATRTSRKKKKQAGSQTSRSGE